MSNIKDYCRQKNGCTTEFHNGIHGGVEVQSFGDQNQFSRTDGLPYFVTHGAPRARRERHPLLRHNVELPNLISHSVVNVTMQHFIKF